MFFVVNKSKVYSYLIALCTVVILFVVATTLNDTSSGNMVETGANVAYENNAVKNEVYQDSKNTLNNNVIGNQNIMNNSLN